MIAFLLVLSAVLCCYFVNCATKSSSGEEEEPKEEIRILTTFNATYTLEGAEATGTVRYVGNNKDVTVNLGEQADLGTAPEGETRNITVYIKGDGALERVFENVPMSGTKSYTTDVLELEGFDWEAFFNHFAFGNKNVRWNQEHITVYFNPDRQGTGETISDNCKNEILKAINNVKECSSGFIKSITHYDGDKPYGEQPPDGEIWVFADTDTGNPYNINWPGTHGEGHVDKAKVAYYPRGPGCGPMADHETIDAMFSANQNPFQNWEYFYFEKWILFLFKRPVSDEWTGDEYKYRIYLDREEEEGFTEGVSGNIEEGNSVKVLVKYEDVPDPTAPLRLFRNGEDSFIRNKRIIKEIPNKDIHKEEKKRK